MIFRLEGAEYVDVPASEVLPPLTADVLSGFVEESWALRRTAWMRTVREWARRHAGKAGEPPV